MVAPTERINDGEGRRRSGKPFTRKTYSTRRAYTPQLGLAEKYPSYLALTAVSRSRWGRVSPTLGGVATPTQRARPRDYTTDRTRPQASREVALSMIDPSKSRCNSYFRAAWCDEVDQAF